MSLSTRVAAVSDPTLASILGATGLAGFPVLGEAGVDVFPAFAPISDYSTLSQEETISGGGVTDCAAFWINPDGLQLFTGFGTGLTEWSLSPAWDLSSATFVQTVVLTSMGFQGMQFSPDGTVFFGCTQSTGFQVYTLGTAWDITTLGSATFFNSQDNDGLQGITVAADGSLTVTGNGDSTLWSESTMSAAFDPSTLAQGNQQAQAEASSVNGLYLHGQGNKLYAMNRGTDILREYDITDNDITTRVLADSTADLGTPAGFTVVAQFYMRPDGSELIINNDENGAPGLEFASYLP